VDPLFDIILNQEKNRKETTLGKSSKENENLQQSKEDTLSLLPHVNEVKRSTTRSMRS
jgi:hypothetical protein